MPLNDLYHLLFFSNGRKCQNVLTPGLFVKKIYRFYTVVDDSKVLSVGDIMYHREYRSK